MPGNSSYDDITSTTIEHRLRTITDQYFNQFVLFSYLDGDKRVISGGDTIVLPIQEAKNTNAFAYSGYATLPHIPIKPFTSATFDWRQYTNITLASGKELAQNSGKEAYIGLWTARADNTLESLKDELNIDMFAAQSGDKLSGLQSLVHDTGLGTAAAIGNIDPSTYTYWKNQYVGSVGGSANYLTNMQTIYSATTFGTRRTTMILTTETVFNKYALVMEPREAFVKSDGNSINASYEHLTYKTIPVHFDRACGSGRMYFLNTNYLKLYMHADRNMTHVGPFELDPTDSDGKGLRLFVMCALVTNGRRYQGVLTDMT